MAHQEPTILELADKYANAYFMGKLDEDARTRLHTAIIKLETDNHNEVKRLESENAANMATCQGIIAGLTNELATLKQQEPEAMRYGWDGHGYLYIDNGSGSDWQTRHPHAEPMIVRPG